MGPRGLALGLVVGGLAFVSAGASAVAAPAFLPAEALGGTGTVVGSVQTAMAPNGFAIVGWAETLSGGQSAVRVATRPPGGPWSSAQQLELGTTPKSARFPVSVAIDSAGDAAIAWDDQASMSSDNVLVSTRAAGQPFGAPQPVAGAANPAVGVDGSGHVTMIDGDVGVTHPEVARTWSAGTTMPLLPVTNLGPTGCPYLFAADLAVAPGGDAIAGVNCGGATTGGTSFVRRIGGVWQLPVTLGHNTINGTTQTSGDAAAVAIDGRGVPAGLFVEEVSSGLPPATTSDYLLDLAVPTPTGMQLVTPPVDTATASGFGGFEINFPDIATAGGSELVGWAVTGLGATGDARVQTYKGSTAAATPQTLGSALGGPSVALSAAGSSLAVFQNADGKEFDAASRPPGGTFANVPLATGATPGSVAIDDAGDGVAVFAPNGPGSTGAVARGFDATPPAIQSASIPAGARIGQAVAFTASAADFWGPVSLSWNFADGGTAAGTSASHVFTSPGSRSVTLTATDAVGNAVSRSGRLVVSAIPPVLSKVSETHSSFRVGSSPTAVNGRASKRKRRPPTGTTFAFRLNEAASVAFAFTHGAPGRRSGSHCVKPSKRLRSHRACTRVVSNGTIRRHGVAGGNRLAFSGRIGGKALPPGSYAVTLTPTAFGVAGRPRTLKFTIVR